MKSVLGTAMRLFGVMTVLTGILYPAAVTGIAHVMMSDRAGGSLIEREGRVVGSDLVAQSFTSDRYFWPRPSAGGYATVASAASHLGPASEKLRRQTSERALALRVAHGLRETVPVPAELITASASGLDPHLTPEAVLFQVPRVARARGRSEAALVEMVQGRVEPAPGGWLGVPRVNVLRLNLALDGAE